MISRVAAIAWAIGVSQVHAAAVGCASDSDCTPLDFIPHAFRCTESNTSTTICHIPGPSGVNGTCECTNPTVQALCGDASPAAPGTSRFLMIGDSISMGMQPDVFAALEKHGIASVHNSGNAANTNKGVHCLDSFLGVRATWDVISFQFGLHDLAYDTEQLTQAQYRGLLTNITQRIDSLNTQVVWTTTTPVPDVAVNPPRFNSDVIALNAIALDVVTSIIPASRLTVVHLYDWVIQRCGAGYSSCPIQLPNNVHYTTEGWAYLAGNMTAGVLAAFDRIKQVE